MILNLDRRLAARAALSLLALFAAAAGPSMAATVRWTGAAQDVRQVSTITVAGTWATGDTATLTINNKSLTVTVGAATSTSNVADILARAVDAANATADLGGTESRNFGGEEIPEFAEIDASDNGAVLTLTSAVPGVPFTLTRSEATAGDGTLGAVTAVTAATGKNWLSNAANYSGGSIPVDNDVLVFDSGDVSVLYALDHFRTNNIDLEVIVYGTWTGQLGLPAVNVNEYREYRARYFQQRGGSKFFRVIGDVPDETTAPLWVDFQDQAGASITLAGKRGEATPADPSVSIAGAHASTLTNVLAIERGNIEIEPSDAGTDATKYAAFVNVLMGTPTSTADDLSVTFGANARGQFFGAITMSGGNLVVRCPLKVSTDESTLRVASGVVELRANGDYGTVEVHSGGTVYAIATSAYSIDDLILFGGTFDMRQGIGNPSGINQVLYAGSSFHWVDGGGGSPVVQLVGCTLSDVTLTMPPNRELDMNTTASP
jgi:hypothetical protein